jgi:hypothetical protein
MGILLTCDTGEVRTAVLKCWILAIRGIVTFLALILDAETSFLRTMVIFGAFLTSAVVDFAMGV